MTLANTTLKRLSGDDARAADALVVNLPAAAIDRLSPEFFSVVESGHDALQILKLMRFQILVASLDVGDMKPWELFHRARRTQARLRCVLVDERMTEQDEMQVRLSGAITFSSIDPLIHGGLLRGAASLEESIAANDAPIKAPP